jgi:hypothetical protein
MTKPRLRRDSARWVSIRTASIIHNVPEPTLHYMILKGKIPIRVEMVQRKRVRPRDVWDYVRTRTPDYRLANMEKARLVSLANRLAKKAAREAERK